jgi:hypothetical protein
MFSVILYETFAASFARELLAKRAKKADLQDPVGWWVTPKGFPLPPSDWIIFKVFGSAAPKILSGRSSPLLYEYQTLVQNPFRSAAPTIVVPLESMIVYRLLLEEGCKHPLHQDTELCLFSWTKVGIPCPDEDLSDEELEDDLVELLKMQQLITTRQQEPTSEGIISDEIDEANESHEKRPPLDLSETIEVVINQEAVDTSMQRIEEMSAEDLLEGYDTQLDKVRKKTNRVKNARKRPDTGKRTSTIQRRRRHIPDGNVLDIRG